jgi:hypothetical protein
VTFQGCKFPLNLFCMTGLYEQVVVGYEEKILQHF